MALVGDAGGVFTELPVPRVPGRMALVHRLADIFVAVFMSMRMRAVTSSLGGGTTVDQAESRRWFTRCQCTGQLDESVSTSSARPCTGCSPGTVRIAISASWSG